MAENKRNDRRSGPEGSFWWFDWLGNMDDRAELLTALNSSYSTFTDAWNHFTAPGGAAESEGLTLSEANWTDARIVIGPYYWVFNDDGIIGAQGNWSSYSSTPFAYAADGGYSEVVYYGDGTYDPYSLHLGYWYANTSDSVSSGNAMNTNFGGDGKVWQTFSNGIDEPYMRGKSSGGAMMFSLTYDPYELYGLRTRFGVAEDTTTVNSIMDDVITSMTDDVQVTTLSSQPIFNEIVLDKGFDYSKRSFLSTEEEEQAGIQSSLSFVSASAPTNGNGSGGY